MRAPTRRDAPPTKPQNPAVSALIVASPPYPASDDFPWRGAVTTNSPQELLRSRHMVVEVVSSAPGRKFASTLPVLRSRPQVRFNRTGTQVRLLECGPFYRTEGRTGMTAICSTGERDAPRIHSARRQFS